MARAINRLRGRATELARKLKRDEVSPAAIRELQYFHSHYPGLAGKILREAGVTISSLGLKNDAGRLVLAGVARQQRASQPGPGFANLSGAAKALAEARVQPRAIVDRKNISLRIEGYDQPGPASPVTRRWNAANKLADRMSIFRSTPAIRRAEACTMIHDGSYARDGNGYDAIESRAKQAIVALCAPSHCGDTEWMAWDPEESTKYAIGRRTAALGSLPILIESSVCREAIECGVGIRRVGAGDGWDYSHVRRAELAVATMFAIDPDFAELLASDPVESRAFITSGDASVLAPAYTSFVLSQELVSLVG